LILAGLLWAAASPASADAIGEALEARLTQVAAEFAPGGTRVGSVRSGTLVEGEAKRIGLTLESDRCYVFIGVGAPELQDLDLALEADGERLGEDTRPDNYPVVRACTPMRVRVEVVLSASSGGGRFLFGQFEVPDETPAGPGEEVGARLRAAGAALAPGMTPDGDIRRGRLIEDEVAAVSWELRGGRCHTFAAFGGPGLEDVNLQVFVGPRRAGDDMAPGSEAVVRSFCPAQDTPATVRVIAARGTGTYALGVWTGEATGPLTAVSAIDTAYLTRRLAERAAAAAAGMNPVQSAQFGSIETGRSANVAFPVEAGRCYRVIGVAEPALSNLDLTFFVDGRSVAEDLAPGGDPVVGYCAAAAGGARVDVWAVAGAGGYALGIYAGENTEATTRTADPLETLLHAAAQTLARGATLLSDPFIDELTVTASRQYDIQIQAGRCYAFVAVSDTGNLDLELFSGNAVLGRDDDLDNAPGLIHCAQEATTVRARLTLLSASGRYAFGVFDAPGVTQGVRPQPTITGQAVGGTQTDYVATRIRAAHAQRAAALLPVSDVQRGDLQQAATADFLLTLPAGRCYTIIAAGVPSVRDLDITLTSPYGQVLATDATDDATPVLITNPCPQWSGEYRIRVYMQLGYGAFGFQVFSQ
jgi:hypothetical protein